MGCLICLANSDDCPDFNCTVFWILAGASDNLLSCTRLWLTLSFLRGVITDCLGDVNDSTCWLLVYEVEGETGLYQMFCIGDREFLLEEAG